MPRLTLAVAMDLIEKLSRTAGFPGDKDDVKAMARTLIEAAPDTELAVEVIEELRKTCEYCPSDALFFKTAQGLKSSRPEHRPFEQNVNRSCPFGICDGFGYVSETVRAKNGMLVDASRRCKCMPVVVPPVEAPPARGTKKMKQVAADYAKNAAGEGEEV